MKIALIVSFLLNSSAFAWGVVGHQVIAEIASKQLEQKTQQEVKNLLGDETLAQVASWADQIRRQKSRPFAAWHIVNTPEGKNYEESKKNSDGDIIAGLETLEKQLRDKNLSKKEKAESLKLFVHFMGDIHQPLHSGYEEDMGANKIKIHWRGNKFSLHELWDETMIEEQKLSTNEYVIFLKTPSKEQIKEWSKASYLEISQESRAALKEIYKYDMKEDQWENHYLSLHKDFLNKRLLQAGIRLGEKLNSIFQYSSP